MHSKYDSIINYDYQMKHDRMPINNRASIFAPFSALTGYAELIEEKGRETILKKDLDENLKSILDNKLKILNYYSKNHPGVIITYFIKDNKKQGGKYEKMNGYLKKIDFYHQLVILENKERIKIENIIDIDSIDVNFDDILS